MYICLLLLNEIVYQIQGLYLHYGTQVCFHVAYKIHGLWAAQSSEMLLFPLPEGYPNIEAVNGSPRKEVCDMKFKIIVFKFVVSRLGFYHACQTFASFFFFSSCGLVIQMWISFMYSQKEMVIQPLCG